jgi:hypothetical protein
MKGAPEETLVKGFVLQGFDRATKELRIELHLRPAPLERLRAWFDVREDVELCDAYPWTQPRPACWRRWSANPSTRKSTTSSCNATRKLPNRLA